MKRIIAAAALALVLVGGCGGCGGGTVRRVTSSLAEGLLDAVLDDEECEDSRWRPPGAAERDERWREHVRANQKGHRKS